MVSSRRLQALIEPRYPQVVPNGRRPPMLRNDFLENWYALSDSMAEETPYVSEAMCRVTGIGLRASSKPRRDYDTQLPVIAEASRADRGDLSRSERASGSQGDYAALWHAG